MWLDEPAGTQDLRIFVALAQVHEPVGGGDSIVVEKRDDFSRRRRDTGIPRSTQSARLEIFHQRDTAQVRTCACEQFGIVIHHDDDLAWWMILLLYGLNRGDEILPAPLRIGADHH
jgi:hypothetical protein